MVITIKIIYKLIFIIILFFLINLCEVDSNSEKMVFYNNTNIHNEDKFKIYFKKSINSHEIKKILNDYKMNVISYIIDDEEYYAWDIDRLIEKYIEDKNLEEKIYYKLNGINIDGINVICEHEEIRRFSLIENIY